MRVVWAVFHGAGTKKEWEDAFVQKLFGFQFVNNFFFLFFIAFFKYLTHSWPLDDAHKFLWQHLELH